MEAFSEINAWANVVQAVGFPVVVTWFLLSKVTPFVTKLADEVQGLRIEMVKQTEILSRIRTDQLSEHRGRKGGGMEGVTEEDNLPPTGTG